MPIPLGIVVDDDAQIRQLFARILRRGGLRTLEARSGREALRLAQMSWPDFVVTDIEMADLDGVELCRRLRLLADTKLAIVAVSGAAATQADEAIAAGCDVVLPKPCSPTLLLETIQRLLVNQTGPTGTQ